MVGWRRRVAGRVAALAGERRVRFTLKAMVEISNLDLGLDLDDCREVLSRLKPAELFQRMRSAATGEWLYVFKTQLWEVPLYVKVVVRDDCLVVSFHPDEVSDHGH